MATHRNGARSWFARLWERLGGEREGDRTAADASPGGSKPVRPRKREWALLESVHSAALASLFAQQLQRAGIPVLPREFGGGSALLGGVPVGVSLFVPEDRLAEARMILEGAAQPGADDSD